MTSKSRKSRKSGRSGRKSNRSGRKSRSSVRIPISKEGAIKGYRLTSSASERRNAVRRAAAKAGKTSIIRRLNALSIMHKNSNVAYSKRAKADMKYVQTL
jgi:hypothetical protein